MDLDLQSLAGLADRIVTAVGREGLGYPCYDAAVELARRLHLSVTEMPGGHVGFVAHPAEFARTLMTMLT